MKERLYLLRISLNDTKPEIWRRFVVPASIELDQLHNVIQVVMGWENDHLYEFTISKKRYSEIYEAEEQDLDAQDFCLGDVVKRKGSKFSYWYDFGDSWIHEIRVENSHYPDSELSAKITCLDGAVACPPEDIGGIPGFEGFRDAMTDPKHENHNEFLESFEEDYDFNEFSTEEVNKELLRYISWFEDPTKK